MSEPGVVHWEANLSEQTAVCVYDSSVLSSDDIMAFLAQRTRWPATLVRDVPLG